MARAKRKKKAAGPKATVAPAADGTRERMVAGAVQLLASRGLQATSFSEVLALTLAPRGSLYHHFPDGKDELVKAALALAGAQMARILAPSAGAPAEQITELFLRIWRTILTRSQMKSGCAVAAVTVATDSRDLLHHTAEIFRSWRAAIADLLVQGGLTAGDATGFAATLIAACEGAVILSRGEQSLEPFELVAAGLVAQVRLLAKGRG